MENQDFFGSGSIPKIMAKIAPPVMLAQLIQALYNIVDSFFVGRYSADALTAVTVIYPLQLIIIALAVGTGVGVNTYMARKYAQEQPDVAQAAAGTGFLLALISWALFALVSNLIMVPYVRTSATEPQAIAQATAYGRIVCTGALGTFLEGNWSKVHQSRGNMRLPMIAQIAGALLNVVLDPVLIFGFGAIPSLGVAGAAYATVAGQILSAVIVGVSAFAPPPRDKHLLAHCTARIYHFGYSSIIMQALYTVYIVMLNMILSSFSDAAVTVLGLYYKLQGFFFIPLIGLQTCIVPMISYNFTRGNYERSRDTMNISMLVSAAFMIIGIICFVGAPRTLVHLFSDSAQVMEIGEKAFPIIGTSLISAVFSLMLPVFFQAIGRGVPSLMLSLTRQIFVLVPVFWIFSKIGLNYTWIAFPVAETVAGAVGLTLYARQLKRWHVGFIS